MKLFHKEVKFMIFIKGTAPEIAEENQTHPNPVIHPGREMNLIFWFSLFRLFNLLVDVSRGNLVLFSWWTTKFHLLPYP